MLPNMGWGLALSPEFSAEIIELFDVIFSIPTEMSDLFKRDPMTVGQWHLASYL